MKPESEIRAKLQELLSLDARCWINASPCSKVAACKALLWALGENDDDRWYITAGPGPAVDRRVKDRN